MPEVDLAAGELGNFEDDPAAAGELGVAEADDAAGELGAIEGRLRRRRTWRRGS